MIAIKTHYTNGQIECEGFVNGELQVGNWIFYLENGKVISKGQFDNYGNPIGVWTELYAIGQMKYEAISSQGNAFSIDADNLEIINYWTEDGIQIIVDGNGKLTTYFDNGNIEHISLWTGKLKNGTLQEFYENGQLKIEREYKKGVMNGFGKVFSENGTLIYEYFYLNGKQIGKVKEWYESGQIAEESEYIAGEYFVNNFWTETGEQTVKNGTGKAIRKYGANGGDVYEQHFFKGKMTIETKIASITFIQFIPE